MTRTILDETTMTLESRTRIRGLLLLVLLSTVACGGGGGGGGGGTGVPPPNPTLYGNLTITQDNADIIALAVVIDEREGVFVIEKSAIE